MPTVRSESVKSVVAMLPLLVCYCCAFQLRRLQDIAFYSIPDAKNWNYFVAAHLGILIVFSIMFTVILIKQKVTIFHAVMALFGSVAFLCLLTFASVNALVMNVNNLKLISENAGLIVAFLFGYSLSIVRFMK